MKKKNFLIVAFVFFVFLVAFFITLIISPDRIVEYYALSGKMVGNTRCLVIFGVKGQDVYVPLIDGRIDVVLGKKPGVKIHRKWWQKLLFWKILERTNRVEIISENIEDAVATIRLIMHQKKMALRLRQKKY